MIDPNNDKKMFLITELWNGLGQRGRAATMRSCCTVFSLKKYYFLLGINDSTYQSSQEQKYTDCTLMNSLCVIKI